MAITSITRVSTAADGTQGSGGSANGTLSAGGRFVAFQSQATNLVPGDTNGQPDIFVKDLASGVVTLASTAADGTQANRESYEPSLSGDGRFVVFHSLATNLVPGNTDGTVDLFVKDLATGAITRAATAADGTQGNAGGDSGALSADGRFVAFHSSASNLVPGDTNDRRDVFVKVLSTGAITRASTAADGTQGNSSSIYEPSLSADGRFVAFGSYASNLVLGDTNGQSDIFVKDLTTGAITLASTAADGTKTNAGSSRLSLSGDGHYVAFVSSASNLVAGDTNGADDIFVKNLTTGAITRASTAADGTQANHIHYIYLPFSLSADGRFVAFASDASNLVPGDTNGRSDIFVKDLTTGAITRASTAADGTQGNYNSLLPSLSADGRFVAFTSDASNLVPGDTNNGGDIFLVELGSWTPPPPQPTYSIAPQSVTVNEAAGTASFTVSRSVTTAAETLYVSTVENQGSASSDDYVAKVKEPLAFAAGDGEETVTVTLNDDTIPGEGNETFGLIVQRSTSDPLSTSLASATFTIEDNDRGNLTEVALDDLPAGDQQKLFQSGEFIYNSAKESFGLISALTGDLNRLRLYSILNTADDARRLLNVESAQTLIKLDSVGQFIENSKADALLTAAEALWKGFSAYKSGEDPDQVLYATSREMLIGASSSIIGTLAVKGALFAVVGGLGITGAPAFLAVAGLGAVAIVGSRLLLENRLPDDVDELINQLANFSETLTADSAAPRAAVSGMVLASTNSPPNGSWHYDADTGDFISLRDSNPQAWEQTADRLGLGMSDGVPSLHLAGDQSGEARDDLIVGALGNDVIEGKSGNDVLAGLAGQDKIRPGPGQDSVLGGDGQDLIAGKPADLHGDAILDFSAADTLRFDGVRFAAGNMTVTAGSAILNIDTDGNGGKDTTVTLEGDFPGTFQVKPSAAGGAAFTDITYQPPTIVEINGTNRNDRLTGGDARERIDGKDGSDVLIGNGGDDTLLGGRGLDRLEGGTGDDLLQGGDGNDILLGGNGNDTLIGGAAVDALTGGGGGDLFVVDALSLLPDTILDFKPSQGDSIGLGTLIDSLGLRGAPDLDDLLGATRIGRDVRLTLDTNGIDVAGGIKTVALLVRPEITDPTTLLDLYVTTDPLLV